ncbi:MAG TPA: glutaminase A [Euzebyales bacterium]|nr:glutaminase A [Euzebyales bacterium]
MGLDLDEVLREVADRARPRAADGEVSPSVEGLDLDPDGFGLALVDMDGTEHVVGDVDEPFAIQSISKVFSLVLAMQSAGAAEGVAKELWERVGVEPSGDPFNSLVQLEYDRGVPRNPMINAGALIVDDVLLDHRDDPAAAMCELVSDLAGERVEIDERVRDGADTSARNRAIASLMEAFGNLTHDVDDVLLSYGHQCAVAMTARQLARAMRFLGNGGVDPASGRRILHPELARRVTAIMLTCGTYDSAGEFAFDVGFPCKSGVAGGIAGVVRDRFGVCVWSPPLEESGNSLAGHAALQDLSERLDLWML